MCVSTDGKYHHFDGFIVPKPSLLKRLIQTVREYPDAKSLLPKALVFYLSKYDTLVNKGAPTEDINFSQLIKDVTGIYLHLSTMKVVNKSGKTDSYILPSSSYQKVRNYTVIKY